MARLAAEPASARADRILEREYEDLRRPTINALRARLASQRIRFDEQDLDAFYNQAWHGLHEQLVQGEQVDNHGGFLVQAAYRRSIDELRREQPDRRAGGVDPGEIGVESDLAATLDDRRRLTALMEGMRERLDDRELEAATLCYLHGLTRPQAAEAMGLSPKRMEKLMDGVSAKLGVVTAEIDAGTWCESRQSLMKAYAFGVLDPDGERYALAEAHLRECPGCRKYVRNLRGMGAVLPPIVLPIAVLGLLGAGGATAAAAGAGGAAAAAGAGGGAAAGAGGTGGAGAAAGAGLGGWATAGLAAAAVAAAGVGGYAVVSSGGGSSSPSKPAATTAPPARAAAPKPKPKPKPAPKAKPKPKQAAPAPAPAPAPAATTPAAAPAPAPVTTTPAPTRTTPAEPPAGGEQEFGFER